MPLPHDRPLAALADRLEAISRHYRTHLGIDRPGDWFLLKLQEEVGELTQAYLAATGRSRRDSVAGRQALADEAADVLCQLMVLARAEGIDMDRAVADKWLVWEARYGLDGG